MYVVNAIRVVYGSNSESRIKNQIQSGHVLDASRYAVQTPGDIPYKPNDLSL